MEEKKGKALCWKGSFGVRISFTLFLFSFMILFLGGGEVAFGEEDVLRTAPTYMILGGDSGQVEQFYFNGTRTFWVGRFIDAVAIEQNPVTGAIWVVDTPEKELVKLNHLGQRVMIITKYGRAHLTELRDLGVPVALGIDPFDYSIWVADKEKNKLRKINAYTGEETFVFDEMRDPEHVVINPNTERIWAANKKSVVKLNRSGEVLVEALGFNEIIDIAVDKPSKGLWVLESDGRLTRLGYNGGIMQQRKELKRPKKIVGDPTGGAWVLDQGMRDLVRINEFGQFEKRLNNPRITNPKDISLEPRGESLLIVVGDNVYRLFSSTGEIEHVQLYTETARSVFFGNVGVDLIALEKEEPDREGDEESEENEREISWEIVGEDEEEAEIEVYAREKSGKEVPPDIVTEGKEEYVPLIKNPRKVGAILLIIVLLVVFLPSIRNFLPTGAYPSKTYRYHTKEFEEEEGIDEEVGYDDEDLEEEGDEDSEEDGGEEGEKEKR